MKIQVSREKITLAFVKEYPFTEDEVQEKVLYLDYNIPETKKSVIKISSDGRQSREKRYIKEDIEIGYDSERGFLSSEGVDVKKTAEGFNDVMNIAKELCDEDLEIKWCELIFECKVKGNKKPLIIFDKTLATEVHEEIKDIIGAPVHPLGLSIYTSDKDEIDKPLNEIVNWSHFSFSPLARNPNYYYGRVVFREKDGKDVHEMAMKIEEVVESLIELLERD